MSDSNNNTCVNSMCNYQFPESSFNVSDYQRVDKHAVKMNFSTPNKEYEEMRFNMYKQPDSDTVFFYPTANSLTAYKHMMGQ